MDVHVDLPLDGGVCLKMRYLRDVTVIDTVFSVRKCHVYMYVCMYVSMYVCMYVHMPVYVCVHESDMSIFTFFQWREPQMFAVEPWVRFAGKEQLRDLARKSGSQVFNDEHVVLVTYEGTMDIKMLAFYEICLSSTEMRCVSM
jgi:hypothetical protein